MSFCANYFSPKYLNFKPSRLAKNKTSTLDSKDIQVRRLSFQKSLIIFIKKDNIIKEKDTCLNFATLDVSDLFKN